MTYTNFEVAVTNWFGVQDATVVLRDSSVPTVPTWAWAVPAAISVWIMLWLLLYFTTSTTVSLQQLFWRKYRIGVWK